jgi:hypothetical protein
MHLRRSNHSRFAYQSSGSGADDVAVVEVVGVGPTLARVPLRDPRLRRGAGLDRRRTDPGRNRRSIQRLTQDLAGPGRY